MKNERATRKNRTLAHFGKKIESKYAKAWKWSKQFHSKPKQTVHRLNIKNFLVLLFFFRKFLCFCIFFVVVTFLKLCCLQLPVNLNIYQGLLHAANITEYINFVWIDFSVILAALFFFLLSLVCCSFEIVRSITSHSPIQFIDCLRCLFRKITFPFLFCFIFHFYSDIVDVTDLLFLFWPIQVQFLKLTYGYFLFHFSLYVYFNLKLIFVLADFDIAHLFDIDSKYLIKWNRNWIFPCYWKLHVALENISHQYCFSNKFLLINNNNFIIIEFSNG